MADADLPGAQIVPVIQPSWERGHCEPVAHLHRSPIMTALLCFAILLFGQ